MIVLETNMKQVISKVSYMKVNIAKSAHTTAYNIAKFAEGAYLEEAIKAGIKPWGGGKRSLFRDTRARRRTANYWEVRMPLHGVTLDRMGTHFVQFKRGRLITRWARDRGIQNRKGVTVHAHPFISKTEARIVLKARSNLRRDTRRAVKKSIKR